MATEATAKGKNGIGKEGIAEVSITDDLRKLGWRVEKLTSGYSAYEIHGDRKIGPATSIKALQTQVMLASGPAVAKAKGQPEPDHALPDAAEAYEPRLPTMEEPQNDELNRLADIAIDAKEAKEKATAQFKDDCDSMRNRMRDFDRKRYTRRGFTLVIEDSEKLVIKKAEQAPPKNPKKAKVIKV